ncbi:MAG: DUF481 domain-containing protein [Pseudomonadota bacterium]|nr:DUF481 domain-containing protein [Pseudomonadota bacterium]
MRTIGLTVMSGLLLPLLAHGDDAASLSAAPPSGWTGKGQAGYVSSQGNAQSKSANAALDASLATAPWKHQFHVGGLYGQSTGLVSAERWDTAWQSSYDLSASLFTFAGLRYARDLFSGFDYQATGSGGLGYKVFDTPVTKLTVQVGAGYRRLRPELLIKNPAGAVIGRVPEPAQSSAIGTFGADYSQVLSNTTTLSDKLLVESGSLDTLVTDTLALAVKVAGKLALSVGYAIQHNTKPPAGLKRTDTLETVNLVYSF